MLPRKAYSDRFFSYWIKKLHLKKGILLFSLCYELYCEYTLVNENLSNFTE